MTTRRTTPNRSGPAHSGPLYRHATGQYCRMVRGKRRYFGSDPVAALARYQREYDDLMAGREPRQFSEGLTLRELCNAFLAAKSALRDADELSPRTYRDYYDTCVLLLAAFGKEIAVAALTVPDFERLRSELAKTLGPVALSNTIQRVRTTFKYGFDAGLVQVPIRFGPTFKKPSRKEIRKADRARGLRLFEAAEVRAILEAATGQLRAMVLLGINCGFGNTDVASLTREALDLRDGWHTFPRPKNQNPRRCALWPETVQALKDVAKKRPSPKDRSDADLVFVTKYGHRWVRTTAREDSPRDATNDAVAWQFRKLVKRLGIRGSFYDLRRTFRTQADNSRDREACALTMGWVEGDVLPRYLRRIEDSRLRAVTECVRKWLWPKTKGKAK